LLQGRVHFGDDPLQSLNFYAVEQALLYVVWIWGIGTYKVSTSTPLSRRY